MSKDKMTPLPWLVQYNDEEELDQIISDVNGQYANLICKSPDKDMESFEYFSANAEAIVNAVNSTYGNGIDPSSIKELYDCLEKWVNEVKDNDPSWKLSPNQQDILIAAKETIEKAKIK